MPNDDLERFRKFMLEQQAQFWADLRAIEAKHAETAAQQAETARLADENRQRIAQLVDVCMSLTSHLQTLGEETDRRFRETDYKLNALIDTVDKLVRRDGKRE